MLMGIELNIIYYTVIFILDSVCQFHIQIMWYTHICYPIDILSAFEFILIEKVHLDDLDLYVITFCCVSNISLTLIISIETY